MTDTKPESNVAIPMLCIGVYADNKSHIRFVKLSDSEVENVTAYPSLAKEMGAMPTEFRERVDRATQHWVREDVVCYKKGSAKSWNGFLPQPGWVYVIDGSGEGNSIIPSTKRYADEQMPVEWRLEIKAKADAQAAIIKGEAGAQREDWRQSLDLIRGVYQDTHNAAARAHLMAKVVQYISRSY